MQRAEASCAFLVDRFLTPAWEFFLGSLSPSCPEGPGSVCRERDLWFTAEPAEPADAQERVHVHTHTYTRTRAHTCTFGFPSFGPDSDFRFLATAVGNLLGLQHWFSQGQFCPPGTCDNIWKHFDYQDLDRVGSAKHPAVSGTARTPENHVAPMSGVPRLRNPGLSPSLSDVGVW